MGALFASAPKNRQISCFRVTGAEKSAIGLHVTGAEKSAVGLHVTGAEKSAVGLHVTI